MLTPQNHVSLSNLTTIRSFGAGSLKSRAWETLRAAVQGVPLTRAVAPIWSVARIPGGSPIRGGAYEGGNAAAQNLAALVDQDLPRMRRGVERC